MAILLSFGQTWLALVGLIVVGVGCAPVYPAVIHSTPANFGKDNARALIGIQMAFAYTGAALMPLLFGVLAQRISFNLYPVFLLIFAGLMFVMIEVLNKKVGKMGERIEDRG